jgi:galactokinase
MDSKKLSHRFAGIFGARPAIFSAPGRVNLIGEHTDYNEGFVMPCAIGLRTRVGISPRRDTKLRIESDEFPGSMEFESARLPQRATGTWRDYVLGIAVELEQRGEAAPRANLLVESGVPIGAGLSSSAAIEVASALALLSLNGMVMPLQEVAKLCQHVENTFIGARVGIMDQFVSCLGRAGHALLLDCRSLEFELIPIPPNLKLVICNTMVKHQHAGGEYNRRRQECDEGVKLFAQLYPHIHALRDLSVAQVTRHSQEVPETIYKRCLHVVEENGRVSHAAHCLREKDLFGFGDLMRKSHASLRDLYEVSCPELDLMVELAEGLPGHYGGRMTGGGFGGCTVNMVAEPEAEGFAQQIAMRYQQLAGIKPAIYICSADDGARLEETGGESA